MNKVLIVEDSSKLLQPIKMGLRNYRDQFEVLTAANGQEALDFLKKGDISTLVTDLYMPKMDGLELLSYMSQHHPRVPCIVMTAFGSLEIKEALDKLKVYHFLEKPFDLKDLVKAIVDALAQFNEGATMDGLSVSGFLQLIQLEHKTCLLEAINPKQGRGQFYFIDGQLLDAELDDQRGDQAAMVMIGWDNAALRIKSLPSANIEPQISLGLKSLILEAARLKDHTPESTPKRKDIGNKLTSTDLLYQAIRRAENNQFKAAQQILATLLKSEGRNAKGWLWYGRVAPVMKTALTALKNAHLVAPADQEIAAELKKLQSATALGFKETEVIGHCVFCWAPIREGDRACHFCRGHQVITDKAFVEKAGAEPALIEEAFQRYTKIVLLDKTNHEAHFRLAMAHINLGQWDEALDQLYKTRNLDPENSFYQNQLKTLLDHMANLESYTNEEMAEVQKDFHEQLTMDANAGRTILVAEDSATTRKVIKMVLSQEGFNVIEAKDGIEAISRFNEVVPDLVLLDIIMPGMDGYQVLSALKNNKNFKEIPVIMLTARDTLIDKLKGRMSGSDEYLTKPFKPEELMAKIRKHL
jgi:twitching motility two-component system response regulator PilG